MSSHPIMLKLSSHPSNVALVESFVQKISRQYGISPDLHGNILISLTEAVTNAIIHGNKKDSNKTVEIKLSKLGNKIAIRVSDEGTGFDYRNLPDPTQPENITKIGGRGVFLMHQLSDRLSFHNNGSTIEMLFTI